jgi:hypothetical protein
MLDIPGSIEIMRYYRSTTRSPRKYWLVRDTEHSEEDSFMENREMPILHKRSAFTGKCPGCGRKRFQFVPVFTGTNEKSFSL